MIGLKICATLPSNIKEVKLTPLWLSFMFPHLLCPLYSYSFEMLKTRTVLEWCTKYYLSHHLIIYTSGVQWKVLTETAITKYKRFRCVYIEDNHRNNTPYCSKRLNKTLRIMLKQRYHVTWNSKQCIVCMCNVWTCMAWY